MKCPAAVSCQYCPMAGEMGDKTGGSGLSGGKATGVRCQALCNNLGPLALFGHPIEIFHLLIQNFSHNLIHQMVNLSKGPEPGPFAQKGAETQLPSSAKRTCQKTELGFRREGTVKQSGSSGASGTRTGTEGRQVLSVTMHSCWSPPGPRPLLQAGLFLGKGNSCLQ